MRNKGFTLIELLTVIAIIAILAAIVLVTFPMAQDRARDARLINAMQQLRTAAEASYGAYGDYREIKTTGSDDSTIDELMGEIYAIKGEYPVVNLEDDGGVKIGYCIRIGLFAGSRSWCVDSDMFSDYVTGTPCTALSVGCE